MKKYYTVTRYKAVEDSSPISKEKHVIFTYIPVRFHTVKSDSKEKARHKYFMRVLKNFKVLEALGIGFIYYYSLSDKTFKVHIFNRDLDYHFF